MSGPARFFSTPVPLGGHLSQDASALSAVAWQVGRLDVFGIGPNGSLLRWWYDGGAWQNDKQPQDLGGQFLGGGLSAVSWGPGRLDVFGIGPDPDLTLRHW